VYAEGPQQLHVLLAVVYICTCAMVCFALLPSLSTSLSPFHPSIVLILVSKNQVPQKVHHLAARLRLRLPRTIHVRDLGNELGREYVDLLVGAVQQAQCSDLVGRGRVVSGGFGFLAAVGGLESCDFGGLLRVQKTIHS
jgi:hypothetical protein